MLNSYITRACPIEETIHKDRFETNRGNRVVFNNKQISN